MNIFKLLLFSTLVFAPLQCTAQQKNKQKLTTESKKTATAIQKIELEEMTRGARRMVTITPTEKIVEVNGQISRSKTTDTEWNNLVNLSSKMDLKALNTHESPTTKRFYDGAMAATLKVTSNGAVYESQGFDSGTPPRAFSDLYFAVAKAFPKK